MIGGSCSRWRRGAHGVPARGAGDAAVVLVSVATGLSASGTALYTDGGSLATPA